MRILYVINGFDPGGAEHGLLTLLEDGFFAGHDLKILGLCRGRGSLASRIARAAGPDNIVLASTNEQLTARACVDGAKILWRQHRHWRPDIVVLSLKQANVIGRVVTCLFPSSRCVSFEHIARYRARRAEWAYQYLLKMLSFRVDEIWVDCEETRVETARYFLPRRRQHHIVPMFRTEPASPHKTEYRLHSPLRLAAAGRLVGRKNFPIAIESVRRLKERGIPARLDIFGDGPDMASLQASIDAWNLSESVHLVGYRENWPREALSHDIFVNLSDTEGFCIVVAEAMAAGLPVVATPVGGIKEYGRDNENIVSLRPPDAAHLTEHILRLAQDDALRQRLGERARLDMIASHSPSAIQSRSRLILGGAS